MSAVFVLDEVLKSFPLASRSSAGTTRMVWNSLAQADSRITERRVTEMLDDPKQHSRHVRWAVITKIGRLVVEAETADAAREKAERRGYHVLEVNRDASNQAASF